VNELSRKEIIFQLEECYKPEENKGLTEELTRSKALS
jgi:hypothetical protein